MNIEIDYSLELFYDFNGFKLLFSALFRLFGLVWAGFGVLFGEFLQFQLHKARLLCYQSMAIVHYDN